MIVFFNIKRQIDYFAIKIFIVIYLKVIGSLNNSINVVIFILFVYATWLLYLKKDSP